MRERWEARQREDEAALTARQHKDVNLGVRIGVGVVAGVALAHVINGFAAAPAGWALASWANANGIQL